MRFEKLDLNLLVALDALLTHCNISRAAEELHLTQSALSAALARLREYFGDELLVQVARRMEPTPRAEALRDPVRDVLVRIRSVIATRPDFDPATSNRIFTLLASDYSLETFVPELVARAAAQHRHVGFRVQPLITPPSRALNRGDTDMLLIPEPFKADEHPSEILLREQLVCVVWEGSEHARSGLTLDAYLAAGHVVMEPSASTQGHAYDRAHLERAGINRRVAVATYSFTSMASLVVGTSYIATLQQRLAERLSCGRAIRILPAPIDLPRMPLIMQWHTYRSADPAIVWLRSMLKLAVEAVESKSGAADFRV